MEKCDSSGVCVEGGGHGRGRGQRTEISASMAEEPLG